MSTPTERDVCLNLVYDAGSRLAKGKICSVHSMMLSHFIAITPKTLRRRKVGEGTPPRPSPEHSGEAGTDQQERMAGPRKPLWPVSFLE